MSKLSILPILIGFVLIILIGFMIWQKQPTQPDRSTAIVIEGILTKPAGYWQIQTSREPSEIWYVANSKDPAIEAALAPLIDQSVALAGEPLAEVDNLLIVTTVNGQAVISASQAAEFLKLPTFEEYYQGLSTDQQACLTVTLGEGYLKQLFDSEMRGIPPEKIDTVNRCLVQPPPQR